MKKITVLTLLVSSLVLSPVAANATATDYSYLEDMSIKELKALDAAIHELLGETPTTADESAETEEEPAEPVHMTEEEFFNDIVKSYNDRGIVSGSITSSQLNAMTSKECYEHYMKCCEAERAFYEKYKNAVFDDLNIQYLCSQYIRGLGKQLNSKETWEATEDWDAFYDEYNSGYYNRGYVIVELADYWDLPFGDIDGMREGTAYLDSLDDAETRNSQVPRETVKEVQTLLHEIGFKCWNIDGVAGKRTVKAIKRFQEMYGFTVDGMITEELINELNQVKEDKGLNKEAETEE